MLDSIKELMNHRLCLVGSIEEPYGFWEWIMGIDLDYFIISKVWPFCFLKGCLIFLIEKAVFLIIYLIKIINHQ